jgi:hypothetical protein
MIALMLGMGVAGDPHLEVYIRAGLLFWLVHYAAFLSSVLAAKGPAPAIRHSGSGSPTILPFSTFALLVYASAFLGLVWTDPERTTLLGFMAAVGGSVAVLYGAGCVVGKIKGRRNTNRGCSDTLEPSGSGEKKTRDRQEEEVYQ